MEIIELAIVVCANYINYGEGDRNGMHIGMMRAGGKQKRLKNALEVMG